MARFDVSQVDNYKPSGTGSYFSLSDDGDYAKVRLMYRDMDDVELFSVHEVEVNGQTYWVNCLREYNQPVNSCPLCARGEKIQVKMWVPLYLVDTNEVKIWERGRTFISKLQSAERRFNPLVSNVFEIERNGKKGDQNTTYELIHISQDDTTLEQLPELPQIVGTVVKELTYEELQQFLNTGVLPGVEAKQQTRNPATDRRPSSNGDSQVARRTTARTRTAGNGNNVF